jgi:ribonuclease BN (tRNA processing enzyme)
MTVGARRPSRRGEKSAARVEVEIWGARGSRSLTPPVSKIANYTSCYSIRSGSDLFVLDGGRGLGVLSHRVSTDPRFSGVERIHLLLSHSHMDHWEGLKDASWFWRNGNGLKLRILGAREAIDAVDRGYGHPAYVPLSILASRTLKQLEFSTLDVGANFRARGWSIRTFELNHYSGAGEQRNRLDTLGYRLRTPEGLTLSYLCDHEPTDATGPLERRMIEGAHIAIVDAHFANRAQHAYGHGSQEHAAELARRHPETLVLAAHHGPTESDGEIRKAWKRHGKGLRNYALAEEGLRLSWNPRSNRLSRLRRK